MVCLGSGGGDRGQAYGGGRGAPTGGHRGGRKRTGFVWPWAHTGADQHGVVFPRPALIWPPPAYPYKPATGAFPAPSPAHPPPAPAPPTPVPSAATIVKELEQRLFVLAAAEKAPVVAPVSRKGLARPARLGAGTVAMIRLNHRRRAGGRRAPTGLLCPPPGPSAPPWPHEGVYQHGIVFAGTAATMRANHRRRARGRGGGRVPTDFLWPPPGQSASAPPWPHEGACQHGVVFAGPALTPSARAYAYAPSSTPSPAVASSQAGLPVAEKTPKVDTSLVSPAHPARPWARTVGAKHLLLNLADDMLPCDVSINTESQSRPADMEILCDLIKLHGQTYLGGNLPAYDGTKGLYIAGPLPFEFAVTLVDTEKKDKQRTEKKYKITIHIPGRTDLFHLQQLLRVRQGDMPQETIHDLDFVLRESPSWNSVTMSRSFLSTTFARRGDIGEGLECWRGPTLMRLPLSIGISAACFLKPVTVQEFQSITNNHCYTYGRWTLAASDVKFTPAIPNSSQPVREVTISSSSSSSRMIGTSKLQVIFRIGNFAPFPMQFEDTSTIEQILFAAFQKQKIKIFDAVIRFNSRNAYLDDTLRYLNISNDKECSLYIVPRLRGGQPPSSSKCSAPPRIELFIKYLSGIGDELFDVVLLPPHPDLIFIGMDPYFVSLGLEGIEIAKMLFDLLESYHERQECVSHFILANLDYDPTSKKLLFRGGVRTVDFNQNNYCNNMYDAGTVLSEIFRFDELKLLAGYSGIRIPPGTANNNGKIPKLVQLLIHDLQIGIRSFPGAGMSKRARAYFRCHVALMTPAARLAFWLTSELHFEYMGGEQVLDAFIGELCVPDWSTYAILSPAMKTVYFWRTYDKFSLGCQWSCSRNFLSHARQNLGALISEKQAEAYLNNVFEWLLYYVLLKSSFPGAVINWNKRPLPRALPPPPPPYPVPVNPAPRQLKFSNDFTFDQLIDTSGSLG